MTRARKDESFCFEPTAGTNSPNPGKTAARVFVGCDAAQAFDTIQRACAMIEETR
jgi:hypothetical protein